MQNPMYASPQVPQMVATTPYFNGNSPYMMPQQQQNPGYYTPMGPMQVGGPQLGGPQPYMAQPYPEMIPRRGGCCGGGCCDCHCCNYCLGCFASLCICCFCCGDEAEDCCC